MELEPKSTNVWDYKPFWCQPWSIILTGASAIAFSWLILHQIWLTIALCLPIAAWWVYFLIIYPRAFADYVKSRSAAMNLDS